MKFRKNQSLTLLLALIICLSVSAQAELGETTLLSDYMANGARYISSFEFQDGALYFIRGNNLGVLPEGEENPKEYPLAAIAGISGGDSAGGQWRILKAQGQLYLLNEQEGTLYSLSLRGEIPEAQPPVHLSWDSYVMDAGNGQTYVSAPTVFCLLGGRLFALERDMNTRIVSFSPDDGAKTTYETTGIEAMAAYQDGKLLVLSGGDPRQGKPADTISIFDAQADELMAIGTLNGGNEQNGNIFGFCYDADLDTLFIGLGQQITRYDALQDGIVCAILPPVSAGPDSLRLISDDLCAVLTPRGILLRSLNPTTMLEKETLSVQGDLYSVALMKTAMDMQDVNIISFEPQSDTTMIGQLISGSADVDIFNRSLQLFDFLAIRDKGYFADLTQSAKLKEHYDKYYPFIRNTLGADGKIAALPSGAILTGAYMYDTAFFEETGLDVPETFEQMCTIIADWPQKYAETYPQMQAVDMFEGPRRSLFRQALDLYMNHMALTAQDAGFDTPVLRRLLTAAEAAAARYPAAADDSGEYYRLLFSSREQIQLSDYRGSSRDSQMVKPLFLSVDKESTPPVALLLEVLLINPHSTHRETSLRFLENAAANTDEITRMMLSPLENAPLLNPNYDLWVSNLEDSIQQTKKRIAEAQGAQRREQEAMLERQKAGLLDMEQAQRYLVDESALAAYREDIEGGFLPMGGLTNDIHEAIQDVQQRYADGQIDMEQFIKEADNKLRLVRLENQ